MAAAEPGAAVPSHGVDFVDENNARGVLLALLKHIAHAACPDAHEHLDEIRPADGEKRHVRLARNRARQQRLARSRRADQQHPLGDAAAEFLEPLRVFEELDKLFHFVLGFLHARNLFEGDAIFLARKHPRLALAKVHRPLARHADLLAEKEVDREHDDENRQQRHHGRIQETRGRFQAGLVSGFLQILGQIGLELIGNLHPELRIAALVRLRVCILATEPLRGLAFFNGDLQRGRLLDLAARHHPFEFVPGKGFWCAIRGPAHNRDGDNANRRDNQQNAAPIKIRIGVVAAAVLARRTFLGIS